MRPPFHPDIDSDGARSPSIPFTPVSKIHLSVEHQNTDFWDNRDSVLSGAAPFDGETVLMPLLCMSCADQLADRRSSIGSSYGELTRIFPTDTRSQSPLSKESDLNQSPAGRAALNWRATPLCATARGLFLRSVLRLARGRKHKMSHRRRSGLS